MAYKAPVNYRSAASRTPTPEAIAIDASGLALLAEAPADPLQLAMTVLVGGVSRTRTSNPPSVGQYRIITQTVLDGQGVSHIEYLPILQFNAADANLTGTVDYWRTGTVLTDLFFTSLIAFVTPLVVSDLALLPSPGFDQTLRGRLGDVAMVSGLMYWSDGVTWNQIAGTGAGGGTVWTGSLSLAAVLALAMDAGYVSGGSGTGDEGFVQNFLMALDGVWTPPLLQSAALALPHVFAMPFDGVGVGPALTGDMEYTHVLAMTQNAIFGILWTGAMSDAYTFGMAVDGSFSGAPGGLVPNNPGFESAVTETTPNTGAWWKTTNTPFNSTAYSDTYASTEMTGSNVFRLNATSGTDNTDPKNPVTVYATANLSYRWTRAEIEANDVLTFDTRLKANRSVAFEFALWIDARDANGSIMSTAQARIAQMLLQRESGPQGEGQDYSTLYSAVRTLNVTRSGLTFNLRNWVTARLAAGKVWADVVTVSIQFTVIDGEVYIDNFR